MSALDDLIQEIADKDLRRRIEKEVATLKGTKKFGLVFDPQNPECTPLYDIPIKKKSLVALKAGKLDDLYRVTKIVGDKVSCVKVSDRKEMTCNKDDLISVAKFGDPIYPYLQPLDTVCNAPDSSLWHALIESDNYHALQLLKYLYCGKVDCIYIDPPYNTGARDWKYNNSYVDGDDHPHSKWLAMIERRLKLAKDLLNPRDSVLIVTIDDNEIFHLGCLLEEIFRGYDVCPVIINHHPQGGAADNISRTHEYALFVVPHGAKIIKGNKNEKFEERWSLMRGGTDIRNLRRGRPNSFYAIYVDKQTLAVKSVGRRLAANDEYKNDAVPENCLAFYPIGKDGTERVWRYERDSMLQHINDGEIICTPNMTLNVIKRRDVKYEPVFSLWTDGKYNAGTHGTNLIREIFCGQNLFSYPKSLYAVHDALKFSTQDKPDALIVDFFAGSGTTLHAVNLLNSEDGGNRRCILVTNNEVSDVEEKILRRAGHTHADDEWQKLGVARYVTWPRTVCSITGHDINGVPLNGNYLGSDLPMADGFKANAAFFKLGFLDKDYVALGRQFKELLPVLWFKAGCRGKCPTVDEKNLPPMMILLANNFAVLLDEKFFSDFEREVLDRQEIDTIFIITDSDYGYHAMIKNFADKTTYQLYRDYLENFKISG